MKTIMLKLVPFCAAGALILALGAPAGATQTNTPGAVCTGATQNDRNNITYTNGVLVNLAFTGAVSHSIECGVPRNPLPAGATTGSFFVDGSASTSGANNGTVSSFNFNGTFLGSQSFSGSGIYDILVTFPAAQLPTFAYVSASVSLTPGSAFRGVTANQ